MTSSRGMTVGLISLGCPKNRVDSEIILGRMAEEGYRFTPDLAAADMIIVNTCGFIEEAKQESIDAILEMAELKSKRPKKLVVAGCMVNRYGDELRKAIPEIDVFVSLDELRDVSSLVQIGGDRRLPSPSEGSQVSTALFDHHDKRALTTPGYAYLKVSEGCNNPCTFCAIPIWRGKFRSRSIESLVSEAQAFEADGIRELCLVAQDTTRYGEDLGLGRHGLLQLVESLLAETNVPWIRFLYAYPTTLDRELLGLMGSEDRFCSYLDIPLQHSHPEILKAMRRGGSSSRYLRLLDDARRLAPGVHLRSTFIVGFPGETEDQFSSLLDFVDDAEFDHLGAFPYSPEPGTPAAGMGAEPSPEIALERQERLLARQRPHALRSRQALVGRELKVLVEGVCSESEHLLQGRHEGMAPEIDGRLLITDGVAPAGEFAKVRIVEAFADDVVGHIVAASG